MELRAERGFLLTSQSDVALMLYCEPEAVGLRLQEAGRLFRACASANVCAQAALRAPKPDEFARMGEALEWIWVIPHELSRERTALMSRALGKTWQAIAAELHVSRPTARQAHRTGLRIIADVLNGKRRAAPRPEPMPAWLFATIFPDVKPVLP